jgi:predicted TIM-barrel fold metal-dependent hydrolase
MAALRSGESAVTVKTDAEGNPELHYPGDYNTAVPGHRDIAYRQAVLEREGVTTQIVSLTTPGTHVETPARAVKYASMVNDEFAKDVQERSPRFAAYATLPLNDPKASVIEFRRAVE